MAPTEPTTTAIAQIRQDETGDYLYLAGRLDADGTAVIWTQARQLARPQLRVEAAAVEYCDGAGLALIYALIQQGAHVENLPQRYGALLNELNPSEPLQSSPPEARPPFLIRLGARAATIWHSFYDLMEFTGELTAAWGVWLRKPGIMRWGDMLEQCLKSGVNALPIVLLVAFLFGVILAFQSAVPMRQFGAELFVANLVGLSLVRELAPLMTAVLLAGRTGAAFAAEIGTMKVNEEINALITLGLEPVRFLVLPRILAVTLMAPLLTVLAEVIGILGAGLVLLTFNIPLQTTVAQVMDSVDFADYVGGLAKATVYGFGIAVIGCRRGLNTGAGASAVGASTTQAVVSSIVMLVVADGLFAVAFYYLGW